MEKLIKDLEVVFTLARMKQTELNPQDEQAIIALINLKAEIISTIKDAHNGNDTNDN